MALNGGEDENMEVSCLHDIENSSQICHAKLCDLGRVENRVSMQKSIRAALDFKGREWMWYRCSGDDFDGISKESVGLDA